RRGSDIGFGQANSRSESLIPPGLRDVAAWSSFADSRLVCGNRMGPVVDAGLRVRCDPGCFDRIGMAGTIAFIAGSPPADLADVSSPALPLFAREPRR